MQDPSKDEETAWSSFLFILMFETLPLCSLRDASMIWVCVPIFQILTSPSMPPEMILWQSLVRAREVTPWLWASLMT